MAGYAVRQLGLSRLVCLVAPVVPGSLASAGAIADALQVVARRRREAELRADEVLEHGACVAADRAVRLVADHSDPGKVLVTRYFEELFNQRRLEDVASIVGEDYVEHALAPFGQREPRPVNGPDALRQTVAWLAESGRPE